jgi:hypothetical protein
MRLTYTIQILTSYALLTTSGPLPNAKSEVTRVAEHPILIVQSGQHPNSFPLNLYSQHNSPAKKPDKTNAKKTGVNPHPSIGATQQQQPAKEKKTPNPKTKTKTRRRPKKKKNNKGGCKKNYYKYVDPDSDSDKGKHSMSESDRDDIICWEKLYGLKAGSSGTPLASPYV